MAKERASPAKERKRAPAKARARRPVGRERRRAPRIKVNLPANWEGDRGRHQAHVTSLSTLGCFVLSGGTVDLKELIRLEIKLPGAVTIHVWAEVVDAAADIGFALQFTSSEAADEKILGKFVAQCLAAEE